jgi:hypothetical protein
LVFQGFWSKACKLPYFTHLRVLTDEDVAEMLPIDKLRRSLQSAFRDHSISTSRTSHHAFLGRQPFLPLRELTWGEGRSADAGRRSWTRVLRSTYFLYNGATGALLLIADADHLTNLRTTAAAAVATEALALPDARVLGIFGTGKVARAHGIALALIRSFEILICGSSKKKAYSFAAELSPSTCRQRVQWPQIISRRRLMSSAPAQPRVCRFSTAAYLNPEPIST